MVLTSWAMKEEWIRVLFLVLLIWLEMKRYSDITCCGDCVQPSAANSSTYPQHTTAGTGCGAQRGKWARGTLEPIPAALSGMEQ